MVVVKKGEPWELLLKQTNFPNRDLLLFKSVCWDSPFYNYYCSSTDVSIVIDFDDTSEISHLRNCFLTFSKLHFFVLADSLNSLTLANASHTFGTKRQYFPFTDRAGWS